jgi:hypothetical protein
MSGAYIIEKTVPHFLPFSCIHQPLVMYHPRKKNTAQDVTLTGELAHTSTYTAASEQMHPNIISIATHW